jgi:hypothetical protein
MGFYILNYLDDLAGVEKKENADFAYLTLTQILEKSGIEEAPQKCSPPSHIMVFLGVLFNSQTMTMEITPERLLEIKNLIKIWLQKKKATVKEIQSLLGKLNFVGACVKPGRIFVNRLLNWLRSLHADKGRKSKLFEVTYEVRKDIQWWDKFLPLYNGISLMYLGEWTEPDSIFSSDACLEGCGGFWNGNYFHSDFPTDILKRQLHIGALEMLSLLVCLKLWGKAFCRSRIVILCDNTSVCIAVNTGKTKCPFLQECLREICFIAAVNEFEIKAEHIKTGNNRIADHLSRWHMHASHEVGFRALTKDYTLKEWDITPELFQFSADW